MHIHQHIRISKEHCDFLFCCGVIGDRGEGRLIDRSVESNSPE